MLRKIFHRSQLYSAADMEMGLGDEINQLENLFLENYTIKIGGYWPYQKVNCEDFRIIPVIAIMDQYQDERPIVDKVIHLAG